MQILQHSSSVAAFSLDCVGISWSFWKVIGAGCLSSSSLQEDEDDDEDEDKETYSECGKRDFWSGVIFYALLDEDSGWPAGIWIA